MLFYFKSLFLIIFNKIINVLMLNIFIKYIYYLKIIFKFKNKKSNIYAVILNIISKINKLKLLSIN